LLAGGAALSGAHLAHRLSKDVDLFFPDAESLRVLATVLTEAARAVAGSLVIRQDAGSFVRAELTLGTERLDVDLAVDASPLLAPPQQLEGVDLFSLEDLRASKLSCLVSRSEPRDLVDVFFLEKAGFVADEDLALAIKKDAGVDPAVLGWLLGEFPTQPLPTMLQPLTAHELQSFRDDLRARMKRLASKA
jgi:predicted nucleotidyltransferase component of viral defense system